METLDGTVRNTTSDPRSRTTTFRRVTPASGGRPTRRMGKGSLDFSTVIFEDSLLHLHIPKENLT
jgi:hypothetical protein